MYVLYQRVHHYKCYGGCSNVMTILRWCWLKSQSFP
jgi:hypothetical protein